ncbi:hypothetical protein H3H37_19450 [Duganella sp. LX20W]|uniref:Uncharacterized protein n=1 Tax=Rugamonas brunnea TaxID=2758569 RepID=A0A7W2IDB6_9BURK|nr:hypothetical protein [Rugamonas brunnea]MBA5639239.1 hypothetical protein [Rugamonas brunnea]
MQTQTIIEAPMRSRKTENVGQHCVFPNANHSHYVVYSAAKSSNPQAQIETIRIPVYNATIDLAGGNAILQRAGKPLPASPAAISPILRTLP